MNLLKYILKSIRANRWTKIRDNIIKEYLVIYNERESASFFNFIMWSYIFFIFKRN